MMADPASRKQLKKAGEIADRVDPIFYELRETHSQNRARRTES